VRLQSAPRGVPTRKGRRQTCNDAFNNSITRGFAAVGEPNVAVCLLPGTEVAFKKGTEFERGFGLFSSWKREKRIGDKVARFRHLNADKPNMHHDALEFPKSLSENIRRDYKVFGA
jgi:hypothetical protein